jgi:hypothetical protein
MRGRKEWPGGRNRATIMTVAMMKERVSDEWMDGWMDGWREGGRRQNVYKTNLSQCLAVCAEGQSKGKVKKGSTKKLIQGDP